MQTEYGEGSFQTRKVLVVNSQLTTEHESKSGRSQSFNEIVSMAAVKKKQKLLVEHSKDVLL